MIERFLEAFFRHKLLVLLPIVVIPLVVGPVSFFLAPSYYESFGGVWTERPAYLKADQDMNAYLTPAQIQKDRLTELMQSRAFLMDVARRTPYASLLGSRGGQERVADVLQRNVGFVTNGSHLLVARFRGQSAQISVQVLNAMFEAYQEKSSADQAAQGELAISFYQGQLQEGRERLGKANDDLRRYVASNPRLTAPDAIGTGGTFLVRPQLPTGLTDPQAADLLRRVDSEQKNVDAMQSALDRAQLAVAAAQQGQDIGFQVVDPPQQPLAPTRDRKRVMVFPIAGVLLGIGISAALLIILVAGDRTVRWDNDLAGSVRVVGSVPRMKVKRLPQFVGIDTTRRAIGFATGAALPPPREAS